MRWGIRHSFLTTLTYLLNPMGLEDDIMKKQNVFGARLLRKGKRVSGTLPVNKGNKHRMKSVAKS